MEQVKTSNSFSGFLKQFDKFGVNYGFKYKTKDAFKSRLGGFFTYYQLFSLFITSM